MFRRAKPAEKLQESAFPYKPDELSWRYWLELQTELKQGEDAGSAFSKNLCQVPKTPNIDADPFVSSTKTGTST